jgi:hypothetical protein
MSYTIRSDLQRAILSGGFLIGALGVVVVIAFASVESLLTTFASGLPLPDDYHTQLIIDALHSDTMMLAVPILCALPFTTAFVDDRQSGFIKQFLPRSGVKAYIGGKLVACAISGGLVLFVGILLAHVVSTIVLLPMEGQSDGFSSFMTLLENAGMFFWSGMFWSLVGFTLASVTRSRYIAYAAPFIFFYILVIIYERYLDTFYYLYPKEWLNPVHDWVLGDLGPMLILSLLTIGISAIFAVFAREELCNG